MNQKHPHVSSGPSLTTVQFQSTFLLRTKKIPFKSATSELVKTLANPPSSNYKPNNLIFMQNASKKTPHLSPFGSVSKLFSFGAREAQKTTHKNKLL
jgi:thymidylate synthase